MSLLIALQGGSGSAHSITDAGGIASVEAHGGATISVAIAAAGIASAESHGAATISAEVSGASIPSAETFGAPALNAVIQSSGIASAEAFGQPSVSVAGATQEITGSGGIASEESFAAPTVVVASSGARTFRRYTGPQLVPTLWPMPSVHYIHGTVSISSSEAFGRPIVTLGARAKKKREEEMMMIERLAA